jgi:hypothetical protein
MAVDFCVQKNRRVKDGYLFHYIWTLKDFGYYSKNISRFPKTSKQISEIHKILKIK